jgi:ADP-dependent NAD(P)H-hydrate dehydratase / NAD(P)H-hydrate epimerase
MLVTCQQMQEAEQRAFERGVSAADLMEQAGCGIAAEVVRFFPKPGTLIIYLGSGNNAGDALVAARELQKLGWCSRFRMSAPVEKLKPLPREHFETFKHPCVLTAPLRTETYERPLVQLDGLLGIGTIGDMREEVRTLAAEMNALRREENAFTVAMDIPSGLNGDTGKPSVDCVIADLTVTVAYAKSGLVADAATPWVGRLALVPLPDLSLEKDDSAQLLTTELVRSFLPRRNYLCHKGQAGRVGIMAGSRGFIGAAVLACGGALRAGAGLVTLLVKEDLYSLLAAKVPPEVMVKIVRDYREVLEMNFDVLAIGPGLGFDDEDEALIVIQYASVPTVVDADALTMIARAEVPIFLTSTPPRLLTPHPGEMARLIGDGELHPRICQAEMWALAHPSHTLLLKGARTVIATEGPPTYFNTTGHPGMATGGMGDVLTGVCAAFAGQGLDLHRAAGLGAWSCGRAAEIAARRMAQISVLPSDVIRHLGHALHELT